jgi:SAM-dependent methyltransferase
VVDPAEVRERYGQVFDSVAEEYDRERRGYPAELLDAAMREAGLTAGDRVLEVGCGTGLLTEALVARELRIEAIDPGETMVSLARRRVGAAAAVDFTIGRFEDARLVESEFAAVFSASAWHWLDPAVSWRSAHEALAPGGRLFLLQDHPLRDERLAAQDELLTSAFRRAAPELAAGFPRLRDAETLLAGVEERRANISAVWSWLGGQPLGRPEAAELFEDVQITSVPVVIEQTADELNAYMRTTSFHARLTPDQRERLAAGNRDAAQQLGGMLRISLLSVVVSGRRPGVRSAGRPGGLMIGGGPADAIGCL